MIVEDLVTFEDAYNQPKWWKAMTEEIAAINKNQTWTLCDLPVEKKATGFKWIFKTKFYGNGDVQQYEARLVVKDTRSK